MAYVTIDIRIIHHVYKPDFVVFVSFFTPTGSWYLFTIKSAAVFGLFFFKVNDYRYLLITPFIKERSLF